MKRTLFLSAIVAMGTYSVHAVEWDGSTTGDLTVSEDVTVTDTANVGNLTFTGDSTVSGSGSLGGSGDLVVESGRVVFDGVSRTGSTGDITVRAGATLEITGGAKLLTGSYNNSSEVYVSGTLKVESLAYGGSLGALRDNTGSLVLNNGARVEITESSQAGIGASLTGWGSTYTIAVLADKEFAWNASGSGHLVSAVGSGSGSALNLEAGEGATFTMQKDIGAGLAVRKNGAGLLVLESTLNIEGGRAIWVNEGTLRMGTGGNIQSAGDGVNVGNGAIFDLNGSSGGYTIYLNSGGVLQNAESFYGQVQLRSDSVNSTELANCGGTVIYTDGVMNIGLDADFDIEAAGELAYGGINGAHDSVVIQNTEDAEGVRFSMSRYTSKYGALNAAGDVTITNAGDVSLCDNHATMGGNEAEEQFHRAGAINAGLADMADNSGAVTIEAAGDITIADNSVAVADDSAGAIYGKGAVTLIGANVILSGNSSDINYAGAIYSGDVVTLGAVDGAVTITGNTAAASGGALYSSCGVSIYALLGVDISSNSAVGDGGAIYCDDYVSISPVEGGEVNICDNSAGGYGGAIYSYGEVQLDGGAFAICGNVAEGDGGAIYACDVAITADAGDISFYDNMGGGSANDIALDGGVAALSAGNGYTLSLNGGVIGAGSIEISTDAESAVQLGGTNNTDNLIVADGSTVRGVVTEGDTETPVITYYVGAELGEATLQDIRLNGDDSGTLLLTDTVFVLNNTAPLEAVSVWSDGEDAITLSYGLPLVDATTVDGTMTLNLTEKFLAGALALNEDGSVNIIIQLMGESVAVGESFTVELADELLGLLEDSTATYGIYDENGELLGENFADLSEGVAGATFVISNYSAQNTVPEPTTATLSLLALAALAARRRRR